MKLLYGPDLPSLLADPRHQAWLAGHRAHRAGSPRGESAKSPHPSCWSAGYDASARTSFSDGHSKRASASAKGLLAGLSCCSNTTRKKKKMGKKKS